MTEVMPDILYNILTLGYSTRYNQRTPRALRHGAEGAALATPCRIEPYTGRRVVHLLHPIDLVEIKEHKQSFIQKRLVEDSPERCKYLMCDERARNIPPAPWWSGPKSIGWLIMGGMPPR